jgi:prepilin-type N-terminal cleavage/methylation domain-containing protein
MLVVQPSQSTRCRVRRRRGFTLIELLAVISVMSILLGAAGTVFSIQSSAQSPVNVAAGVAGQLDRARSHAIARNTYVWVRLGQVEESKTEFFVGVYESIDGANSETSRATACAAWTAPRFADYKLSDDLDSSFIRPVVQNGDRPKDAAWIRFSPAGEAWVLPASSKESGVRMVPPADVGTLARWTEIGLQATRDGQVVGSVKTQVAAVQVSGLIGQSLQFAR